MILRIIIYLDLYRRYDIESHAIFINKFNQWNAMQEHAGVVINVRQNHVWCYIKLLTQYFIEFSSIMELKDVYLMILSVEIMRAIERLRRHLKDLPNRAEIMGSAMWLTWRNHDYCMPYVYDFSSSIFMTKSWREIMQ